MPLSKADAYKVLELPSGSDEATVRTSYKRLALKWHPDKHANSADSIKRFQQISIAYRRLTDEDYDSDTDYNMSLDTMFELFQQVFFPASFGGYTNGYDSSDYDDEDDDDDDLDTRKHLTAEEIEKNASELITEEEKEKRRAEKRRAKKKRRREKKKLEKQAEQKKDDEKKISNSHTESQETSTKKSKNKDKRHESASDGEDFDPNAAFFTKVVNKKKKAGVLPDPQPTNKAKTKTTNSKDADEDDELDPVVLRSRQLAIRGNEMANIGHYQAAINLFTEAIKLDPQDFRFFGNRSYCYDRIQQHDKALRDADKAISLASDWPKGYFRKGRALSGLCLYADAEQAFMQVLKLDRNCEDAVQELVHVRTHQLTEMGFSRSQAESAIRQYGSVQAALDSLLAGGVAESNLVSDVYQSDEDEVCIPHMVPAAVPHKNASHSKPTDIKMDPGNPEGLTALWVGNVLPVVSEKKLKQMFSKYGNVTSVRCLPEKYCAFINYETKESAGKAMHSLQGVECGGQALLIKFPDNPIVNGNTSSIRNKNTTSLKPSTETHSQISLDSHEKLTGPVNGDECYFWRTTGCAFGRSCKHRHIQQHKGIDLKPWQLAK